MEKVFYRLTLADIPLRCAFQYPDTHTFLVPYCTNCSGEELETIEVGQAEWDFWPNTGKAFNGSAEANLLTSSASDALLLHDRCIMHAVAFRFKDEAWLIPAATGVGKTTQIRTLQELYPGLFSIISGDRPILEKKEDGSFFVHPSPWNGKEDYYGAAGAKLAGILFLRRGSENSLTLLKPYEAVFPALQFLICSFSTEDQIRKLAAFTDALLKAVPAWQYVNETVPGSTRFLYQTFFQGRDAE